jgi:hypothetical protein
MTPELLALLGSIVGGTGALLSYWAGWRARDKWGRSSRYRAGADSSGNCVPLPPAPPVRRRLNPFVSEFQQQINDQLGPTTPKPDIIPKPQPPGGRLIGPNGAPVGYRPKPQFPPPRTIPGNQP